MPLREHLEATPGDRPVVTFHASLTKEDALETMRKVAVRRFNTGATRDTSEGKPDYEAFLSPLVMVAFGKYMLEHCKLPDGTAREPDNWQKGMPLDAYMKSLWRHHMDLWLNHRGKRSIAREGVVRAACAILFNVMGYLHEYLKAHPEEPL